MNIITKTTDNYLSRDVMIPGLKWRGFRGEADFPEMLAVFMGGVKADGLEQVEKLEDLVNTYSHLVHCDPYRDMLFAGVEDKIVGYSRVWWAVEGAGKWIGFSLGHVLPEWRHKGIGTRLLYFNEQRLGEISRQLKESGELPAEATCLFGSEAKSSEIDKINLLGKNGYQVVRYAFDMVRPDLENIPDLPLPPGVELRPVSVDQVRTIWEASNEAFIDHWGYIPDPWEDFQRFMDSPEFNPSLWRVAWQGDQVAGMVLSFIDKDQNEVYNRKRGYTENICVRRPWRRQGLAKALIAFSLKALKEAGMTEAGLGVDAENISGALQLYQSMGYRQVKKMMIYQKPLE